LRAHAPGLAVYQTGGVNIGPAVEHYDPEPDVLVVDAGLSEELDRHYADRFYLAAEVVSASDRTFVESKREVYKLHEACTCILTIWQDRQEVRVDLRADGGWQEHVLTKPDDELVLADFGLRCKVSDVYDATPLQPRSVKPR
jgi:hypothetical protein